MNINNSELFTAKVALEKLGTLKLPVKTSLDIAILANKVNGLLDPVIKVRNGLFEQYSIKIDANQLVSDKEENLEAFGKDWAEALAQERELVFTMISLPERVNGESLQIEPQILMALEKFVQVE